MFPLRLTRSGVNVGIGGDKACQNSRPSEPQARDFDQDLHGSGGNVLEHKLENAGSKLRECIPDDEFEIRARVRKFIFDDESSKPRNYFVEFH